MKNIFFKKIEYFILKLNIFYVMPLHNKTGKRYHRKKLPIQYADDYKEQVYGKIEKALGHCSFYVRTLEGEQKVASLSGVMKKQGRAKSGDVVLIEPMSEDTNRKYQIIFRYSPDQVKQLESEGLLNVVEESKPQEELDEDNPTSFCFEGEEEEVNDTTNELGEEDIDAI